jgi:hypothetical protein
LPRLGIIKRNQGLTADRADHRRSYRRTDAAQMLSKPYDMQEKKKKKTPILCSELVT